MVERNQMVDSTAVIVIFGFVGVIGTMAGLFFWLDRKIAAELRAMRVEMRDLRSETRAEMQDLRTEMRAEMQEMRSEIRRLDRDIRILSAKVDRAQGNLDVLVFGERGIPPSVEAERAELENLAEEAVGN